MKTTKLMTIALCALACTTATTFAKGNGDDLIDSATPAAAIPDPVNPKPGMVFKGYNIRPMTGDKFGDLPLVLQKTATVKTTVVTADKFSFEDMGPEEMGQGVWEGYLKCNRSANCTLLVKQNVYNCTGYILFINGNRVVCGGGQNAVRVDMKAGFNHIKLLTQTRAPVFMTLKATGSVKDPKPFSPKDLFYEEKPDEGDVF